MKIDLTIICPAYNEEAIILECLTHIYNYLKVHILPKYSFELLIINDGSKDRTGELADCFAKEHENVKVVHHFVNMNLGVAIKTGFANAKGEYIVVYDLDLSYSPDHIKLLFESIINQKADIVIASPYMKGGKTTEVPFNRIFVSKWANKYLSITSRKKIFTFSGMVRSYRSSFIKNLSLKASTFEINSEIIFKAQILRARIIEIPAHLDWTFQNSYRQKRFSGLKLRSGILDGIITGFIFRPYMFFIIPGLILLLISISIIIWILISALNIYPEVALEAASKNDLFPMALARIFSKAPHSFLIGGIILVVSLQILGIGFLSFQNKRYFDELYFQNFKANGKE